LTIPHKLSTSLGRTHEAPNIALAEEIVKKKDAKAIAELITLLENQDKNIQSDIIKVLYEIGERKPELISEYINVFLMLLDHTNNRLIWGAMSALDSISLSQPKEIYKHLSKILDVAAKGSVITRDHAVNILINLAKVKRYAKNAQTLLFAEMASCPVNQLPMYAERAATIVTKEMKLKFKEVLEMRIEDVEQESKRRRIEKVQKQV
jgi:hypothetical protein